MCSDEEAAPSDDEVMESDEDSMEPSLNDGDERPQAVKESTASKLRTFEFTAEDPNLCCLQILALTKENDAVPRVVNPGIPNPGIPDDFGIVKSRDLNFGIFGIILIPGFAYRDPGFSEIDFNN
jgi:hypothetical protein